MNRLELLKALDMVKPAVATRDFNSLLKCYCFRNNKIVGYNGELYIETEFKLDKEFVVTGVIHKFLESLTVDEIEIDFKMLENKIKIKAGKTSVTFPILSVLDF